MIEPRTRPEILSGATHCFRMADYNLFVTINLCEGLPFEVFLYCGKSGTDVNAFTEGLGRMISNQLRSGVSIQSITKQLRGIKGPAPVWKDGVQILSVPDAVSKVLDHYVSDKSSELEET